MNENGTHERDPATDETAEKLSELVEFLRGHSDKLVAAAAGRMTEPQIFAMIGSALARTPKILQCTKSSVLARVLEAVSLDLDIGSSAKNEAMLNPRNSKRKMPDGSERWATEAVLQIMYAGKAKLARASGLVADLYACPVFKGDTIEIDMGSTHSVRHRIDPAAKRTKATLLGVYAVVKKRDGSEFVDWMGLEEIENARGHSDNANGGPWKNEVEYVQMALKSVVHRATKLIDKSPAQALGDEIDRRTMRFDSARVAGPADAGMTSDAKARLLAAPDPALTIEQPKTATQEAAGTTRAATTPGREAAEAEGGERVPQSPAPSPPGPTPAPAQKITPRLRVAARSRLAHQGYARPTAALIDGLAGWAVREAGSQDGAAALLDDPLKNWKPIIRRVEDEMPDDCLLTAGIGDGAEKALSATR